MINRQKILLIDDNEAFLEVGKLFIEQSVEECTVIPFSSGKRCLEALREDFYSVIILDAHLGDISGLEILKKIREMDIDTPVIILSGNYKIQYVIEKEKAFYDRVFFVEKSSSISEVVKLIRILINDQVTSIF